MSIEKQFQIKMISSINVQDSLDDDSFLTLIENIKILNILN